MFAQVRATNCPRDTGSGDNNLAPLDLQSPTTFDNNYFTNLVNRRGLLHSDQQIYNGGPTDQFVREYYNDPRSFASDFVEAMIKMGDIRPLIGSSGEIRRNCRKINWIIKVVAKFKKMHAYRSVLVPNTIDAWMYDIFEVHISFSSAVESTLFSWIMFTQSSVQDFPLW